MAYSQNTQVCDTPQILVNIGCDRLPMLYTQRHLKDALHEKSPNNAHWHGLTLEQICNIPHLLESPAIIMDSLSPNKSADKTLSQVFMEKKMGLQTMLNVRQNQIIFCFGTKKKAKHCSRVKGSNCLRR